MSVIIDNLITWRILKILVTPFDQSKAFKLGIIDDKGLPLKKASELKTDDEKESYSYLYRLTFNIKRLLNKLPGGDKYTKNIIAAYYLIKESNSIESSLDLEERLVSLIECIDKNNIVLVEEEIAVMKFFEDIVGSGDISVTNLPVNNTAILATTPPIIRKKPLRRKKVVD